MEALTNLLNSLNLNGVRSASLFFGFGSNLVTGYPESLRSVANESLIKPVIYPPYFLV